jgi:hypothetical protein
MDMPWIQLRIESDAEEPGVDDHQRMDEEDEDEDESEDEERRSHRHKTAKKTFTFTKLGGNPSYTEST